MKMKLEEILTEKYPKIFRQKDLPMTQTCMCWGFECDDGWYWLIDQLCYSIQSYVDSRNQGIHFRNELKAKWWKNWFVGWRLRSFKNLLKGFRERKPDEEWQVEAVQVKEKFGRLCFYIDGGDDHIYGMIWLAETMSYRICEACGSLKDVKQTKGWIKSLCPKCIERYELGKRGDEICQSNT